MKKLIGYFLLCCPIVTQAQNKLVIDSLFSVLKKSKDTSTILIYNQLSWEYRNSSIQHTDSFADIAITLSLKRGYYKGLGNGYINKGIASKNRGNYDMALQQYRWALINYVKCHHLPGYSSAYNNIAAVHYLQGNYATALFYYFQSLRISEQLNDQRGIAKSYNNIGVVYVDQKTFDKALIYFNKCYNLTEQLKDDNGRADCLNNIGNVYHLTKNTDQAIENYRKSMEINKALGDERDVSAALNNIGLVFYESGDYKSALSHFHRSLKIDEELSDPGSMVVSYGNLANCYLKLDMLHAAAKYGELSLQLAQSYGMKTDVMNACEQLYQIEEKRKDFEKALRYNKLYYIYKDSIYNSDVGAKLSHLENEYHRTKEEAKRIMEQKQYELTKFVQDEKEKEASQQILITGLVLLFFVIMIYVVFFLIRKNKYS